MNQEFAMMILSFIRGFKWTAFGERITRHTERGEGIFYIPHLSDGIIQISHRPTRSPVTLYTAVKQKKNIPDIGNTAR